MGLVFMTVAAVAWMFWRRRRAKQTQAPEQGKAQEDDDTGATRGPRNATTPNNYKSHEMNSEMTKGMVGTSVSPFEGATHTISTPPPPGGPHPVVPGRHEMDAPHRRTELPAWSGTG